MNTNKFYIQKFTIKNMCVILMDRFVAHTIYFFEIKIYTLFTLICWFDCFVFGMYPRFQQRSKSVSFCCLFFCCCCCVSFVLFGCLQTHNRKPTNVISRMGHRNDRTCYNRRDIVFRYLTFKQPAYIYVCIVHTIFTLFVFHYCCCTKWQGHPTDLSRYKRYIYVSKLIQSNMERAR